MPKFSKICLILATALVSFVMLTACGGGGSAKSASTGSVTAPPAATPSSPPSTPSTPSTPAQTPSTPDPVTPAPAPTPDPDPVTNAPGTASLAWVAPTLNNAGGALEQLAGYRIRYGKSPEELDQSIVIDTPAVLECAIEQLAAGTWYFEVVAYNAYGLEGPPSNLAMKTVL